MWVWPTIEVTPDKDLDMADGGDGDDDDAVLVDLWRRLTRDGRSEPLFTEGPDFASRLRTLLADDSGRALALAMLRHPEPYDPTRVHDPEEQANAFEAELDVLETLHAMRSEALRDPRRGMKVQLRHRRRAFRRP